MIVASCSSGHTSPTANQSQSRNSAPGVSTTVGVFNDISCTANGYCMAIGAQRTASGGTSPLVLSGSGRQWQVDKIPSSSPLSPALLAQVACVSTDDCMIVGRPQTAGGSYLSARWDGRTWQVIPMPIPGTLLLGKDGLSCSQLHCLEVGESPGTGFFALSWRTAGWDTLPPQPMGNSYGINMTRCVDGDSCMVVASPTRS